MESKRVSSNSFCKCWLEEQVLRITINPGLKLTLEGAQEVVKLRTELSQGKSYPILLDIRGLEIVDTETLDYLRGRESGGKLMQAVALIVENEVERLIGEAFRYTHKSYFAYKIFTNEEEALHWISQYVDN